MRRVLDEDVSSQRRRRSPLGGNKLFDFAYLDAGSGSLILQAVLGGIAGIVVAGKAWKARMLGRKTAADEPVAEGDAEDSALTSES